MPIKQIIVLSIIFLFLFVWVLKMIIKNQLRETYAVLWMIVILCIPAAILLYPLLVKIGVLAGFIAPVNFLFVVGFVALFAICLHFSSFISNMYRMLKNTVQKIALLEEEISLMKEKQKTNPQKRNNKESDESSEEALI